MDLWFGRVLFILSRLSSFLSLSRSGCLVEGTIDYFQNNATAFLYRTLSGPSEHCLSCLRAIFFRPLCGAL
ncbi:hypothetical protein BJ170DRAFT_499708 [Xylariales sp. AK1849]|nr:hypothetical protein BJ170DRAFT_499708 [Xylariales sp. AK1849]